MILKAYNDFQQQVGNVLILNSSDYISFTPGYWVFVVNQAFPDSAAVISWCQQQGLNDDDCGATEISHDIPESNGTYVSW